MQYSIQLQAEIPLNLPPDGSDELAEKYQGAKTQAEAAAMEAGWLRGEDGQGDYLEILLSEASIDFTATVVATGESAEPAPVEDLPVD